MNSLCTLNSNVNLYGNTIGSLLTALHKVQQKPLQDQGLKDNSSPSPSLQYITDEVNFYFFFKWSWNSSPCSLLNFGKLCVWWIKYSLLLQLNVTEFSSLNPGYSVRLENRLMMKSLLNVFKTTTSNGMLYIFRVCTSRWTKYCITVFWLKPFQKMICSISVSL